MQEKNCLHIFLYNNQYSNNKYHNKQNNIHLNNNPLNNNLNHNKKIISSNNLYHKLDQFIAYLIVKISNKLIKYNGRLKDTQLKKNLSKPIITSTKSIRSSVD